MLRKKKVHMGLVENFNLIIAVAFNLTLKSLEILIYLQAGIRNGKSFFHMLV